MIESLSRFPKPKEQRDVAGRHYLGKAEINSLYFATHELKRLRGWSHPFAVGRYWRSALVVFFNYGVDTGTVWKTEPFHEPILWRHVSWERQSHDREVKEQSTYGWIFYRRVKTDKTFYRPMDRTVHAHIRSVMPASGPSKISAMAKLERHLRICAARGRNGAIQRTRRKVTSLWMAPKFSSENGSPS